jgi:hypothetical protein
VSQIASVTISGDLAAVITLPKQIQYAALRTTNDLLDRAQTNIVGALKKGLHIRGNWTNPRTKYGINVRFAKKDNLEGAVGTQADWLLEEEGFHGGVKTATGQSNKAGYIPKGLSIPDIGNARPSLLAKMPAGQKAGKLLANAKRSKAFIVRSKNGKRLVLQRVGQTSTGTLLRDSRGNLRIGRKSERTGGTKVVVKAVLQKAVKVPTPHIFVNTGVKTMNVNHYADRLQKNLVNALNTARSK